MHTPRAVHVVVWAQYAANAIKSTPDGLPAFVATIPDDLHRAADTVLGWQRGGAAAAAAWGPLVQDCVALYTELLCFVLDVGRQLVRRLSIAMGINNGEVLLQEVRAVVRFQALCQVRSLIMFTCDLAITGLWENGLAVPAAGIPLMQQRASGLAELDGITEDISRRIDALPEQAKAAWLKEWVLLCTWAFGTAFTSKLACRTLHTVSAPQGCRQEWQQPASDARFRGVSHGVAGCALPPPPLPCSLGRV
jgi:hypothetical protein